MPYLHVQTNQSVSDEKGVLKRLSALAAQVIGKPESYIQTAIESETEMTFGGSDEATAFIQCKSIGLSESQTASIAEALCDFCHGEFGIPKNRVYIEFASATGKMWGWNGGTF